MTALLGPLTNEAVVGGPRASRSRAPQGTADAEFCVFYDEFFSSVVTVGSEALSPWTTITDTGTTAVVADAPNGVIMLSSGVTTENEGASIQLTNDTFHFRCSNEG